MLLRRQVGGARRARPALLSLAFLARAALDAELRPTRERVAVEGCRDLTRGEHGAHTAARGEVRVDPRTHAVTLDGEPVAAPPLDEVALSGRYLLG